MTSGQAAPFGVRCLVQPASLTVFLHPSSRSGRDVARAGLVLCHGPPEVTCPSPPRSHSIASSHAGGCVVPPPASGGRLNGSATPDPSSSNTAQAPPPKLDLQLPAPDRCPLCLDHSRAFASTRSRPSGCRQMASGPTRSAPVPGRGSRRGPPWKELDHPPKVFLLHASGKASKRAMSVD